MEKELLVLINDCEEYLDVEAKKEVRHYFTHSEYEMSLEGLIIEMIKLQKYPRHVSIDAISELVTHYHLDSESVFDYEFWEKYMKWISMEDETKVKVDFVIEAKDLEPEK